MAKSKPTNDDEARWWREDADRLNTMAQVARDRGPLIKVGDDTPPALNPDGSLKDKSAPDDEDTADGFYRGAGQ